MMKRLGLCVAAGALISAFHSFPAMADDDMDAPARAHLAEQMAFVGDGPDQCGESAVPTKWTLNVLSLYMGVAKNAPLENEIAAKQDYLAALKAKIGVEKWCDLYRVEMSEADMMVNLLTEHPELRGH
jgi:hypothetical protein